MSAELTSFKRQTAIAVLLALLSLIPFLNSLNGPWIFDDLPIIARNPLVHGIERLGELWTSDYWRSTGAPSHFYRPLSLTTYAITWEMVGNSTLAFHLTNLLLHAACTLLLWAVLFRKSTSLPAVIASVLFAVHPVHAEAVANIVGRAEVMAGLFLLVAVFAWRKCTEKRSSCVLLGAAAAGMLFSKETGVFLLLFIPFSDFPTGEKQTWKLKVLVLGAAAAIYAVLRVIAVGWGAGLVADVSGSEHARLSTTSAVKALQMLVAPAEHRAVWRHSDAPGGIWIIPGAIMIATLVVLAILAFAKRRQTVPALLLLLLSLIPLLHIRPNVIWFWERGLYVPSMALSWLVYLGLERLHGARIYRAVVAAGLAIIVFFALKCTMLSGLYGDDLRFWEYQYTFDRHSTTAINYSQALLHKKRFSAAVAVREEALQTAPADIVLISALASGYVESGQTMLARNLLTSASMANLNYGTDHQRAGSLEMLEKLSRATGAQSAAETFATMRKK